MKNKPITYKQILEKKDYLPFYVYDYDIIKRQILKLKNNLPENVEIFYSVKANPNLAILKIMNNFNLGAEIISLGELSTVKKANFKSKKILFAGSTKTNNEFIHSFNEGVKLFSIESISELQRLNKVARNFNGKIDIIIRLNLGNDQEMKIYKYSRVSDFGIKIKDFEKILHNFSNNFSNINLKGVHFYGMSRICNSDVLIKGIDNLFSIICNLEKKFDINFKIINIGGGFESSMLKELDVLIFCKKLKNLIKKYNLNNRNIILELGRYFINKSGVYITKIIDVEKKRDSIFLTVKGLLNCLLKTLSREGENKDDFAIEIIQQSKQKTYSTVIRGQMSSTIDAFGRGFNSKFSLPKSKPGDFVIIKGVGAYGLTQALSLFGSRSIIAEFLMINNRLELIRKRSNHDDIISYQRIPKILKSKTINE